MRNSPSGDLGLDASGSFARGASIASQIIENRLRQRQYDISDRELLLKEQAVQYERQQQQVFQQLAQEAYDKPDVVLPQLYARDPAAAAKISEGVQQRYSQQYNTLNLLIKDTKAENKQATYELLRPELERQFPELEFGDKYSAELNNALKTRASAVKAKMKTNLEFKDTAQGIVGFNPQTGEAQFTGIAGRPLATEAAPSSVREYQYFNNLSPAEQTRYLNLKRNTTTQVTPGGTIENIPGATEAKTDIKKAEKLGTDLGEAQAKALANLGNIEDNSYFLLSQLDELKNHAGLKGAVGLKGGGALFGNVGSDKIVSGSPEADFVTRMAQVEGQAFLQAFDTLRGGGQITETEGKKATQARLRMSRATSEKEFLSALNEFEDVVKTGLERQRKQARGEFGTKIKSEKKPEVSGIKFLGFE